MLNTEDMGNKKDVYFCMMFSFVFFFARSMQIPIKIPTGSIQDKDIE
jgi:archaellum biogenesis protein FlaJ (TadC family)